MPVSTDTEGLQVELSRASFELARAERRYDDAVVRAAHAGMSQRAIAAALGTHQVAVHRILVRCRAAEPLPEGETVRYDRPEARFHYELHREIARHIQRGEWSREAAQQRLEDMRAEVAGSAAHRVLDHWSQILASPADDVVKHILVGGGSGDDLRQLSPLLGIVTVSERAAAVDRAYAT